MESGNEGANFKKETVSKLMAMYFKDKKTKMSGDAVLAMRELLRVFVTEAAVRAARQAQSENSGLVDIDHFEKILPQLMLDF
ncbi:centromere protein X [Protopterus annectens]|uniref:centromere protein X n=1 Tax=Protopterus annectens TaxID=7888 RepID=UPI001CFA1D10|nr:centromere protein X [Protopterus annectens]